jgi:DNA-binding ferritin-like protein
MTEHTSGTAALTPQQRYEQEAAQSDKDHHTPTAGAMTGHIVANLFLDILKIRQAHWFAKGNTRLFLELHASEWIKFESEMIARLDDVLASDNEMIPTTTSQINEYGKLEEDPARKYESGAAQLTDLVHDFDWQLIFVGKAIALADSEGKTALSDTLSDFRAWAKRQILEAQLFLGNDPTDGLYKEVDDDDDDEDDE